MMSPLTCSLVLMTRLQGCCVDRGAVIALITVHGLLVLVDVDSLAGFVTKTRLDISNRVIDKGTWMISESSCKLTV